MLNDISQTFAHLAPAVDFWSLRLVDEREEYLSVRQDVLAPLSTQLNHGAFVSVIDGAGSGYAATCDLTPGGLRAAVQQAHAWARRNAPHMLLDTRDLPRPAQHVQYRTPVRQTWESIALSDKITLLHDACAALAVDARIVDRVAMLQRRVTDTLLISSTGARVEQHFDYLLPGLLAVANEGARTQRRTGVSDGAGQGGWERLALLGCPGKAREVAEQALALLHAPPCPTDVTDVLLMPDQMMLQIHESIGHPLELDRILGDERNFAGTSFVTRDMFGSYRYGSELLNVTFDPTQPGQLASYACDDDGTAAERTYLIRDGILQRPLGGATSQARSGMAGVANARACDWNRPAIDRMANLNVEPGDSSFNALVASIEHGVLMETNSSWSIDDSRNKFQFGCELARVIENGELKGLLRSPNYRGVSATFWRNLVKVGDRNTFEVLGTPNCGKGEPQQVIHVGHASPACVFRNVDVFGGAD